MASRENGFTALLTKYATQIEELSKEVTREDVEQRTDLTKSAKKRMIKKIAMREMHKRRKIDAKAAKREQKKPNGQGDGVVPGGDEVTSDVQDGPVQIEPKNDDLPAEGDREGATPREVGNLPRKSVVARQDFEERCEGQNGILIDCSFDHKMTEDDLVSLKQQFSCAYGYARKSSHPSSIQFCGVGPDLLAKWKTTSGVEHWPVQITDEDLGAIASETSKFVYLSGDSDTVLETLEEDKVYILGGIVDHNQYVGLTENRAKELGIPTARLPIGESGIELTTSCIITVDQVAILCMKYNELKDWKKAIVAAIPKRKIASIDGVLQDHTRGGSQKLRIKRTSDHQRE